ncbi:hypothetical protein DPEC_G00234330 [Dallia pectoralis]|uniref:Uncharacterized protein n=1 Tax=Dallia pectoralis TaxID=75939 RepID=A0ACC2FXV1_DALPE|nr:hypothetical protein DPEC_G00234330 [Dallia pectoralis]
MASRLTTLISLVLLQLLVLGTLAQGDPKRVAIKLSVESELSNGEVPIKVYATSVVEGGILLGALRRLEITNQDFKFTVTENLDYGLFLESVNGLAGAKADRTYWELLSESSGVLTRLDTGIGCYRPVENEHIILRFSTWSERRG